MDTRSWEQERLDLRTGIRLDSKNVRLETADVEVEADIMEDLFANEGALGLVEGICAIGYLTHEIPIVVKRGGTNVVVEGNRRMAALKAMQIPMLVPDFSNRISALLRQYPDHPRVSEVDALVAPSQEEADQIIAAIHTGNLRRPWTPSRQAAFFQAQIDGGREYQDLVKRYPTSDVRKFVFRAHVVNRFRSAKYPSPELQDFAASSKFRKGLSTLTRVYEAKKFRELTGLKMEDDGSFSMTVSDDEFDAIAAVIVRDMSKGSLNTRTLNTVKENPRFDQLLTDMGTAAGLTAMSSAEPAPSEATSGKRGSGAAATTDRRPRPSKDRYLNVSRLKIPETYGEGFKQTLEELSTTDVQHRPATAFLLMRSALEKGVKSLADVKGIDIKKSNNQNGYVYLRDCLDWLSKYAQKNGDRWVIQVVSNMSKLVYYTISQDKLNAVNHNHKFVVTPDEAIGMWKSVVSLLEYAVKP